MISLIFTVLNEGEAVRPLLDSLMYQTLLPDEVVVCDGGSTDDTVAVLRSYERSLPIRVIVSEGANISEGRNIAIEASKGDIIAATDAGVVLDPRWVEQITRDLRSGKAEVVAGWFEPDAYSDFEVVMGATVLPDLEDIDPSTFLPSSRSIAFKKTAWETVDGYPEWLDYCEDLIFDMELKERYNFGFAPKAIAYFRPRGTMRAYAKQYYLYSRGDGKADLWRKRHAIRYTTYLLGLPLLLLGMGKGRKTAYLGLFVGGFAYCWRAWERLWKVTEGWSEFGRIRAFLLVPVIKLVGDLAKMAGYPVGVKWRMERTDEQKT